MNLQVMEVIGSMPSKSGKMMPPKVKFDNGTTATLAKGIGIGAFQVGMRGEVNIETSQNGEYTNHIVTSWNPTMPPGQVPAQNFPTETQKKSAAIDQTVWDAKDRTISIQGMAKPAAEIVSALITSGVIKEEIGAERAYEALMVKGYELAMLARADRISTKASPFAGE